MNGVAACVLAGAVRATVVYFLATLMIWLGHYLPHRAGNPLRTFHVGGHHALYPDSQQMLTRSFRYGRGRHDSLIPMLPWLVALTAAGWAALPAGWAAFATLEIAAVAAGHSYLHAQFHLVDTRLAKQAWFRRARARHAVHHDRDVNFMVGDHFWDRVFRTFEPVS